MTNELDIESWKSWAKHDDWHMLFVASDIRQMLGEIERLRAELAKGESDNWKPIETAPAHPSCRVLVQVEHGGVDIGYTYTVRKRGAKVRWFGIVRGGMISPVYWQPLPEPKGEE